jgi:hypothetical protein
MTAGNNGFEEKVNDREIEEEKSNPNTINHFLPRRSAIMPRKNPVTISIIGYAAEIMPRLMELVTTY